MVPKSATLENVCNPMKEVVPRSELLKKMVAMERELKRTMERELKRIAEHVGISATPVQWRKFRSDDGESYYENVEEGTTQWEEPEGADELLTDED